jgi:hypothetical protein
LDVTVHIQGQIMLGLMSNQSWVGGCLCIYRLVMYLFVTVSFCNVPYNMFHLLTMYGFVTVPFCNAVPFCNVPFCNVIFCNVPLYNVPLGNVPLCNVRLQWTCMY